MFNVYRTNPPPPSLSHNNYQSREVVERLRDIFHDKCYLCEQTNISNPEVEHLIPHGDDPLLKYGWDNLFYACRRCNGIKAANQDRLLDCSNSNLNVFDEIVHLAGNAVSGEIEIRASKLNPSQETLNTIKLLKKCFNEEGTAYRDISKESLLEEILEEFSAYFAFRRTLVSRRSLPEEINDATERLKLMCDVKYPFSVFWRWHVITDGLLNRKHPNIRATLGY
jgi:hypothetical protein